RYGFAPTAYGTSEPIKLRFRDEQYDKILKPNATGSGEETYDADLRQGLTYHCIMRYPKTNTHYGYNRFNTMFDSGKDVGINPNNNDNSATYKVTKVNDGQITKYPYVLDDEIEVTNTHAQYYQLNMNVDRDEDGMGDMVVWYCLGDALKNGKPVSSTDHGTLVRQRIYRNSKNDVRNNYFIYSMGNVTYTGQGHRDFSNTTEDEAKLFINTLITAYSAGVRPPELSIHFSKDIHSGIKTTEILPFDTALLEESFNAGGGISNENMYVDKNAYPDFGSGEESEDGRYLTLYFLPEEINVDVEDSRSEVAFFVSDFTGETDHTGTEAEDLKYLTGENRDETDPVYGNYLKNVKPLNVVSVKKIKITGEEVPIEPSVMNYRDYEGNMHPVTNKGLVMEKGGEPSTYQLDQLDGSTMYSVTYDLNEIISRTKKKVSENGVAVAPYLAVHNLPEVYVVLHTRTVQFAMPKHDYSYAELKYARAQLFQLE
ncbi:MAG: hypothetical protein K5985_10365, partial [Lachnospiraceae bacterium]|nr:hypothetical protein [Lachnospiraceae bacterium]